MRKTIIFVVLVMSGILMQAKSKEHITRIELAGEWRINIGKVDTVNLPGTTDTNRKGVACKDKNETTHLTRLYSYKGAAEYEREILIPKSWNNVPVRLFLERTKFTKVYVDDVLIDSCNNISTPQVYELPPMTSGTHRLKIVVDNSRGIPEQLYASSHACTEDTQTNWNGIIGKMYLEPIAKTRMESLQLWGDAQTRTLRIKGKIEGELKKNDKIELLLSSFSGDSCSDLNVICRMSLNNYIRTDNTIDTIVSLGDNVEIMPWSEFETNRYNVSLLRNGACMIKRNIGFVDFKVQDKHFYVNGEPTFLRGKHDACVFPLTAHVPMDKHSWQKYFGICKDYGINHVRFHSWCPPEAAFEAADSIGIYLQPELPFWGDFNNKDSVLMEFLHKEGENILYSYGHHPSFVMFALGNELWGAVDEMGTFVRDFRSIDSSKLYTFGSNYYLGYQGVKPDMDFFVTCRNGGEKWGEYNTHTRGSFSFADALDGGIINHFYPNSSMTLDDGCNSSPVPVISHETGQFQTYPDYEEIKKYTGVLYPYNMEVFRSRLEKAGMLEQAGDFHRASGAWSVQLYKADIELDLRTKSMAGFQLLDLQDYPGQGSAYVGILDAFMESKGIISKEEWRGFCSSIVPLLITDKFCYTNKEMLKGTVSLANYGGNKGATEWKDGIIEWSLKDEAGNKIKEGRLAVPADSKGLTRVGEISVNLSGISKPQKMILTLNAYYNILSSMRYTNTYPIWVYPTGNDLADMKKDVIITRELTEEIGKKLAKGAKVLFMPFSKDTTSNASLSKETLDILSNTVGALFQTDYWNYRMFKTICENNKKPVSPGTLGILTYPQHPLFNLYPTEEHTNWQWFPVIKASRPAILDNLPKNYRPIVQVIDNVERNHKLGLVFEFKVGNGKLLVCMSDLEGITECGNKNNRNEEGTDGSNKPADVKPEAAQFYLSLLNYMNSKEFMPETEITIQGLIKALTTKADNEKIDELRNISFE